MSNQVTPIRASTQSFLEIEDIRDDIVLLKDGSAALIISTTATNFGLLSEKEQDAEIYAYGSLLNSLNFAIQILIRSKRKDVTAYLRLLAEQEAKVTSEELKIQIQKYRQFVQNTVQVNNVLEKAFYIIVPMSVLEIGVTQTLGSKFQKKQEGLPYSKDYILEKAKTNLHPKRDHVTRLLARIGLQARQMTTQELVKLFFGIYNPASQGQIMTETEEYQTPIVKPAAEFSPTASSPAAPPPPAEEKNPQPNPQLTQPEKGPQEEIDQLVNQTSPPTEEKKPEKKKSISLFQSKKS